MKKTLISGNELEEFIISFLDGIKKDIESGISDLTIKITEQAGTFGKIYVVRCTIFEKLISKLTKMANTSSKPFQHDTLKVFLAYILLDITKILFEEKKIDITVKTHNSLDVTYEVRTRHNLLWKEVAQFIKEQYREIIHSENRKNVWWLTFLNKLDKQKLGIDGSAGLDGLEKIGTSSKNSKGKYRRICLYYMIVVEVHSRMISMMETDKTEVLNEVEQIMEKVIDVVREEDELGYDPLFLPVENILPMDKLRDDKARLKNDKARLKKDNSKKDKVIDEKDKVIDELRREIEELKKKQTN